MQHQSEFETFCYILAVPILLNSRWAAFISLPARDLGSAAALRLGSRQSSEAPTDDKPFRCRHPKPDSEHRFFVASGIGSAIRAGAIPIRRLRPPVLFDTLAKVKLDLVIDSKPLNVDIDDIVVALLAMRLNLSAGGDHRHAIARYLSENSSPWILSEEHMRRRVLRRAILDIADPALVIRHLMADDEPPTRST
jgi:hypothetical protein